MQRMIDRYGMRGLRHLLTPAEQAYCLSRPKSAQHVAGRVASKEATYKALQGVEHARGVSWLDVEVHASNDGRPRLELRGRALEAANQLGVANTLISISHSQDTAIAMVVLTGTPNGVS